MKFFLQLKKPEVSLCVMLSHDFMRMLSIVTHILARSLSVKQQHGETTH
jgi:hypothetical protein